MLQGLWRIIERILAPLPGWMMLLSGMAMIGIAMLTPAWVENRQFRYRLDLMRAQARSIGDERQRLEDFHTALANDDPILLERLAYYYLKLQPEGVTTLDETTPARPALNVQRSRPPANSRAGIMPALADRPAAVRTPSVEEMIEQPLPTPGVNYPLYLPVNTRLVRIATGRLRFPLVGAGMLAILAGLFMPTPAAPGEAARGDEEPGAGVGAEPGAGAELGMAEEGEGEELVDGEVEDDAPFDPVVVEPAAAASVTGAGARAVVAETRAGGEPGAEAGVRPGVEAKEG